MQKNITQVTVRRLLPLLAGLLLCTIAMIGWNFRSLVMTSMQEHILSIAQITKAGLTAHMKSGQMEKRAYFLQEISAAPHIQSISIIRTDAVSNQFGKSLIGETVENPSLTPILNRKEPYYELDEWSERATLRAIVPYIATSHGSLNCLQCHHVAENTVLGAVDVVLDVTEYRNWAWTYLLVLFLIVSFFTALILFTTSRIIEEYVRKPLLDLIHLAKSIFFRTHTHEFNHFKSAEFIEVVHHFEKIEEELNAREERIQLASSQFESLNNDVDTTLKETILAMAEAEEIRSHETRNHTRRVIEYSRLLGRLSGMSENDLDILITAAPLHDIGKIGIPDSILLKPGPLDEEERMIIMMHSKMGYDILKHSNRDVLQAAAVIAHEHHERWDGLGYPQSLKGEEIHIFGRIVAIADVFDALSTKRVYKEAWDDNSIQEYFLQERGHAFDPSLVDLFLEHYDRFHALFNGSDDHATEN